MKKTLVLIAFFAFSNLLAALPEIPADCFDDENYCYNYKVVNSDEINDRVIQVNFIAELSADDYADEQEILDRFLDFEAWGDYTQWLEEFDGNYKKALDEMPVVIDYCNDAGVETYNGQTVIVNEASYWTKVPFPVNHLKVVERAFYFPIETFEGALFTWKFIADPNFNQGQGVVYKRGFLSIAYDDEEEVYHAFVTIDVLPDMGFELALLVGAKSVAESLVTIFSGMFE